MGGKWSRPIGGACCLASPCSSTGASASDVDREIEGEPVYSEELGNGVAGNALILSKRCGTGRNRKVDELYRLAVVALRADHRVGRTVGAFPVAADPVARSDQADEGVRARESANRAQAPVREGLDAGERCSWRKARLANADPDATNSESPPVRSRWRTRASGDAFAWISPRTAASAADSVAKSPIKLPVSRCQIV